MRLEEVLGISGGIVLSTLERSHKILKLIDVYLTAGKF